MAGIGFELKKLFKTNSIVSKLRGASYAAITTIGPLILIIVTLFLIYMFLGYNNILFASRELLASTILYVFIFSLCATSPLNAVIARFIADKIFENKEDDILPAYYSALGLNILIASIPGIIFCVRMVLVSDVKPDYALIAYLAYMGLVFVFYSMVFITALKEYFKIAGAFVVGMLVTLITGVVLSKVFHVVIHYAIVTAFALGFLVIAFMLYSLIRAYFKNNSQNYFLIFDYFKQYWKLIAVNGFYTFGLYVHNFIFWTTEHQIRVVNSFISAPVYDMATCIAMFINISTMVIFIVEVETNFHDRYQEYCQTVIGGSGTDIDYAKAEMFRSIRHEIMFIFQFQAIITIALNLVCLIVLPNIGISKYILSITTSLAVAYLIIFIMYNLVIFIFYFNVYNRAMITTAIFFGVTFVGTLISKELPENLYGLGVLAGAIASFTYAYFSIKNIEKNLDYYIFCTGTITNEVVDKDWGHAVYSNDKRI